MQDDMTQREMGQNKIIVIKNTEALIKNLEKQIGQFSRQMAAQASSSGGFIGSTVGNPKNETCKVIKLRNRVVPSNQKSEPRKERIE